MIENVKVQDIFTGSEADAQIEENFEYHEMPAQDRLETAHSHTIMAINTINEKIKEQMVNAHFLDKKFVFDTSSCYGLKFADWGLVVDVFKDKGWTVEVRRASTYTPSYLLTFKTPSYEEPKPLDDEDLDDEDESDEPESPIENGEDEAAESPSDDEDETVAEQ